MPVTIKPKAERDAEKAEQAVQGNAVDRVDVTLMGPGKYEVSPETTFEVKLYLAERDGRWVVAQKGSKGTEEHTVVFRMWTYDEMVEMRKQATTYDPTRRVHLVDQDALNRLKVQKLMVSWTLGKDNPRLEMRHVNGVLTDESWQAFARLQPNIAMYVLGEMNKVYEYNG